MSNGTAVAKRDEAKTIDVTSAKASAKFLDAYNGRIERMSPEQQSLFLIALGQRLGVRAELGELIIYQNRPYISIDGRIRLAHETGLLVGMDVRPATQMERRNYGANDADALWVCDVYRRGAGRAFKGWGCVTPTDKNPVAKTHPRELAKKRAKYDALRSAFPPAEQVSALHERYIEEAEQQIRAGQVGGHAVPMLSGYPDDGADAETTEADVTGNEAAADAETAPAAAGPPAAPPARDSAGELPLGDAPKAKGKNALAEP